MTSRRELMKLLSLSPVAATSAARELAIAMATPAAMALKDSRAHTDFTVPIPPSQAAHGFGHALYDKLNILRDAAEREYALSRSLRVGGLDPDLASLRSTSRSYRVMRQLTRDSEHEDLMYRANRKLWG